MADHLSSIGIADFQFFDAFGPSHPSVAKYRADGLVATFPPCFRCGKTSCGKSDCNNVLIDPQVATFATYLALWQRIAATPQRALIVEDDVVFHRHWRRVLRRLARRVHSGGLAFRPDTSRMIRMGWALGEDHRRFARFQVSDTVKMSNPCHAMTSTFAANLLQRFRRVDTTADIYLHRDAPIAGEAVTVLPPIASELSWSTGQFASLIHPKDIHADFLEGTGDATTARAHRDTVQAHVKHMEFRKILVVGHPRCGTGFAARLLNQMGLDIGHEKDGRDGISSWMFAVDAPQYPFAADPIARSRKALAWEICLQPVRDIATAVPSIMRDNLYSEPSCAFRRDQIKAALGVDLDAAQSNFERAVLSLVSWSRIIAEMQPDLWFRIEDGDQVLADFLVARGVVAPDKTRDSGGGALTADTPRQGVKQPKDTISAADWASLPAETWRQVEWYCTTFGYALPPR